MKEQLNAKENFNISPVLSELSQTSDYVSNDYVPAVEAVWH